MHRKGRSPGKQFIQSPVETFDNLGRRHGGAIVGCASRSSAPPLMNFRPVSAMRCKKAGAAKLMTPELIATLCDHAQGNQRALMNMAGELLALAAQREARQIDEKLFLETCATPASPNTKTSTTRRR